MPLAWVRPVEADQRPVLRPSPVPPHLADQLPEQALLHAQAVPSTVLRRGPAKAPVLVRSHGRPDLTTVVLHSHGPALVLLVHGPVILTSRVLRIRVPVLVLPAQGPVALTSRVPRTHDQVAHGLPAHVRAAPISRVPRIPARLPLLVRLTHARAVPISHGLRTRVPAPGLLTHGPATLTSHVPQIPARLPLLVRPTHVRAILSSRVLQRVQVPARAPQPGRLTMVALSRVQAIAVLV